MIVKAVVFLVAVCFATGAFAQSPYVVAPPRKEARMCSHIVDDLPLARFKALFEEV